MSIWPTLKNAPVSRALIEIRFIRNPQINLDEIQKVFEQQRTGIFSKVEKQFSATVLVEPRAKEPTIQSHGIIGIQAFLINDKGFIIIQKDRMSVHLSKGYKNYEELVDFLHDTFKKYIVLSSNKVTITRIGVRFINKLSVTKENLFQYYHIGTPSFRGMPTEIVGFSKSAVSRYENSDKYSKVTFNLNQEDITDSKLMPSFDIDIFDVKSFEYSPDKLLAILNEIREDKNRIFFGFLTSEGLDAHSKQ